MVIVLLLPLFSELAGNQKEFIQGMVVDGIGREKAETELGKWNYLVKPAN